MDKYEYKVTVIIPVYNSEQYLRECIDSLLGQTIDFEQIQVILIDDGSTDNSLNICNEYTYLNNNIKVYSQQNSGPSVARNLGIKNATGKYIMYLDSDDTLDKNTIKLVSDFFDKHYDEIDMVTYYDQYYKNGKKLQPHQRYKYLKKTGIYDLKNNINIMQVRLNIAVKNLFEKNLLFDENMDYQEDQFYCSQILKEKLTIGYVKEAQYNYLQRESGIVSNNTNTIKMFHNTLKYFKTIFSGFENNVPEYYQVLFLHDLGWKLKQHCLFPYHYSNNELKKAKEEISNLLKRTNVDVILNHPTVEHYHKFYFLELRDKNGIDIIPKKNCVQMINKNQVIHIEKKWDMIVFKITVRNGNLEMLGAFKSVYGSFIDNPKIIIKEVSNNDDFNIKSIATYISSDSYYKAKEITNKFYGFNYRVKVDDLQKISLYVVIEGIAYPVKFYFMDNTALSSKEKRKFFLIENIKVSRKPPNLQALQL